MVLDLAPNWRAACIDFHEERAEAERVNREAVRVAAADSLNRENLLPESAADAARRVTRENLLPGSDAARREANARIQEF